MLKVNSLEGDIFISIILNKGYFVPVTATLK